jgi:hypothetical protein
MTRPLRRPPAVWTLETLEWEDLPALTDPLGRRLAAITAPTAGDASGGTPRTHDAARPPAWVVTGIDDPFREPLHGLAVREMDEPALIRRFFGPTEER